MMFAGYQKSVPFAEYAADMDDLKNLSVAAIADMKRQLVERERIIWQIVHVAGGRVVLDRTLLELMDDRTATLEVTHHPLGGVEIRASRTKI